MSSQGTETKSSLSETISAFSPWTARSSTAKPTRDAQKKENEAKDGSQAPPLQRGGDHSVNHRHRIPLRSYPPDCPPLNVRWFHAVDVAIRKPGYTASEPAKEEKSPTAPKKWMPFSMNDSRSIESAFQTLADEEDKVEREGKQTTLLGEGARTESLPGTRDTGDLSELHSRPNRSFISGPQRDVNAPKVPVNEDYLFDVDIRNRELGPAYWLGPVYAVRRGSWFFVDGTNLKPCDENLATQLEEGYIKTQPWKILPQGERSTSKERREGQSVGDQKSHSRASSTASRTESKPSESKDGKPIHKDDGSEPNKPTFASTTPLTHRLFGAHMNSVVTYQDQTTAWLVSDDFLSRMSSTMYQRFAGGGHLSGTKVIRGFQVLSKKKERESKRSPSRGESPQRPGSSDGVKPDISGEQTPPQIESAKSNEVKYDDHNGEVEPESQVQFLERQMSNLVSSAYQNDPEKQDEEARQREEREIRDDYRDVAGDRQDREIDHLMLVTHGIGQRLGARFETFNFIHDVNELRKTLKNVYGASEDLQALNNEVEKLPKNCRVQVLPICWRHLLDFPRQNFKHSRRESDLADAGAEDDLPYPSLNDITVEGVPALRNMIADLALDILLYQTPAYKDHIARLVARECNRIYKLFKKRNPTFKGQVSLMGHSLGSAIFFDILSEQVKDQPAFEKPAKAKSHEQVEVRLDFAVDNFVCVGSPIGLFQMLNGRTIAGRGNPNKVTLDGAEEGIQDPFHESHYTKTSSKTQLDPTLDSTVSYPKCRQLYNVFHPTDPISYRLEPLISPSMSSLKPQTLPYTKRSFLGAPMGQGLTGIPARVGQSVSGFWSSFSSGIANNFINRTLGISAEDAIKLGAPASVPYDREALQDPPSPASAGAGTNIVGGGVLSHNDLPSPGSPPAQNEDQRKRKLAQQAADAEHRGQKPPTLIDSEIETLYTGFQKRRRSRTNSESSLRDLGANPAWREVDDHGRKLKREEMKVRALNRNGRVDYSIQEGAFDISFLASIASHLAYWTDEDVCHFLLSQFLSKQRARSGSVE